MTKPQTPDDYAFPSIDPAGEYPSQFGLTKREYFALQIYANHVSISASVAVILADKLLSELGKQE